jgi:hypothetical protein
MCGIREPGRRGQLLRSWQASTFARHFVEMLRNALQSTRTMGDLSAGTLLYSATFCAGETAAIAVYSSTNGGQNWTYHTTPARRDECTSGKHKGLWEPHFEVIKGGALVMSWSDEIDPFARNIMLDWKMAGTWQSDPDSLRYCAFEVLRS